MIGIDPRPWTLGELIVMAEGHDSEAWDHTANLMHQQHTLHCPKRRPLEAFHPFLRGRARRKHATPVPIDILKEVFVDGTSHR